jgi:chromate transporter
MVSTGRILRTWGRLGLLGFGGPPAHVALLRELCVERHRWLEPKEFEDANAATQLLPGPASTQLAIYCAWRAGGPAGALVGGLAFILPGLVLLIALAALTLQSAPPRWVQGLSAGAGAAAVAVVAQAGLGLTRTSLGPLRGAHLARAAAYLLAGAAGTVVAGPWVVLVLLAAGLLELAARRGDLALQAWLVVLPLAVRGASELPAVAWTALKVGVLSYGGGFVIVPLMEGDAVGAHHWMTHGQFLNAIALGQLTPGPVFQTVAAVGWAADGLAGALLAATVAFAPSFLVILLAGRGFARLRSSRDARAFLDGAGPAGVGAILGAVVALVGGLGVWWQWAILALGGAGLLTRRAGVIAVLLAAAAIGALAATVGARLP